MTGVVRGGLQVASFATAALAVWLVAVVLFVLPAADPGHVQLWTVVAVASAALVGLSVLATRGDVRPSIPVAALLALLSIALGAFGLFAIGSFVSAAPTADPEGYQLVIGIILAAHGALGLVWTLATLNRSR